jgi:phosphopantetheine adenylyltransferase|tara:strand:- start:489 stop:1526 length:1038 start_codon:yes stop_codon:yes gene_type:complete
MKTAVFTFGRFNPPTIGHEKLINAVVAVNQREGGTALIYGSQSHDTKKNPLTHKQKFKYLKKMFPRLKSSLQSNSTSRNIMEIAAELSGKYNKLIMVAGSDRVSEFKSLLNTYNGKKAKHGIYEFEEIVVKSAGERDPDADGASGMSASKMRDASTKGDFESFLMGVSDELTVKEKRNMMNDVRKGLKLDTIREGMKRRRGLQEKPIEQSVIKNVDIKELSWQGYDTVSLSTCDEAFELFDEIVNSVGEGTFTKAEYAYLKEALILTDKCLTIVDTPSDILNEEDVQNYMDYSKKAISLLENVKKRTGIPFSYSFLNDLQVSMGDEKTIPKKSFTQFSGEMYGIR